jgi:hypothetical protein
MELTNNEIALCIELFNKYSNSKVPIGYDYDTKVLINDAYAKFSYDNILSTDNYYTDRRAGFVKNLWKLLMNWFRSIFNPNPVLSSVIVDNTFITVDSTLVTSDRI